MREEGREGGRRGEGGRKGGGGWEKGDGREVRMDGKRRACHHLMHPHSLEAAHCSNWPSCHTTPAAPALLKPSLSMGPTQTSLEGGARPAMRGTCRAVWTWRWWPGRTKVPPPSSRYIFYAQRRTPNRSLPVHHTQSLIHVNCQYVNETVIVN